MKREGRAGGGRRGSLCQGFPVICAHQSTSLSGLAGRAVTAPHEDVPSSGSSLGFCTTKVVFGERKQHFGRRLGSLFSAETLPELDFCPLHPVSVTGGKGSEPLRALCQQKSEGLEHVSNLRGKWDLSSPCSIQTSVSVTKSPLCPCSRGQGWGKSRNGTILSFHPEVNDFDRNKFRFEVQHMKEL